MRQSLCFFTGQRERAVRAEPRAQSVRRCAQECAQWKEKSFWCVVSVHSSLGGRQSQGAVSILARAQRARLSSAQHAAGRTQRLRLDVRDGCAAARDLGSDERL